MLPVKQMAICLNRIIYRLNIEMLRCHNSSVAYINFYRPVHLFGQNRVLIWPKQKPVLVGQCEKSRAGKTGPGSQSESSIRYILLARATSLIINMNIATNSY